MLKIFKKENEKNNENLLNSSSRTYNCSPTHSQRTSTSIINNSTTTSNNDKIHTTSSTREMIVTSGQLLLSTIEDSFSNYLPAIQKITALCEKIIKSYETVKENKKICRVLIDRVELTHIAVKQLVRTRQENEEKFRDPEYFKAFDRLQKTLENIETFIKKISNYGAFRKFDNADSVKKCFEDYINDLEQVSKDLGFNITLRIYHDLNDLKENNEKYSKMWENFNKSFKNVGKSEIDQVVLIGKIKKSLKSNDFESKEELFKIPEIDTKDIEDVKPQYKKATDIRGKDSNDNTLYVEEYKKYLHLAAKNENVIALFKLGQYYLSGFQGRDQNADLARQYLQSAVLQNYNEEVSRRAIELINNMEKNDTEKTVESKKI
ncbi:9881_t:CDS:2 [Entrophospora sp. SA101]|nr:9881_t:CDS:2 [Entrophospora sp. SA101]